MDDDAIEGHDYADDGSGYTEGEGGSASYDSPDGTAWDGIEHLAHGAGDFYASFGHSAAAGFDAFVGDMPDAQRQNDEANQDFADSRAEIEQANQDVWGN
jgi:hypothetical protein